MAVEEGRVPNRYTDPMGIDISGQEVSFSDIPESMEQEPQPQVAQDDTSALGLPESMGKLLALIRSDNIASDLEEDELSRIGRMVYDDYQTDKDSCSDWYKTNERGLELAKQVGKHKSFPWDGAANVVVPLITQAAIAYNARVYPEIVRNGRVADCAITGKVTEEKTERADRVKAHLNYQLLVESKEWESDTDRLTLSYAINGTMYRKWYYDPAKQRLCSRLLFPDTVIVNNGIESLATARRVTHEVACFKNDIVTQQRAGLFLDVELKVDGQTDSDGNQQPENDPVIYLLEQHRWLDLDGDGLEEPYVVTIHKDSQQVLRIVARYDDRDVKLDGDTVIAVEARNHFVDYHFVPAFAGEFLSYGFGALLSPLNKAANSVLNSLLNAGVLSNTQSGFLAKNFRMSGGNKPLAPGEWRKTDIPADILQNSLLPLPVKEPSAVLQNLFGTLVEMANGLIQVANIGLEDIPANAPATSVLAILEQNSKVFNSVFKRFYRSLNQELRLLADLNSRYLDDEVAVALHDEDITVLRDDYNTGDLDIIPCADPSITTQAQRLAMAQAKLALAKEVPGSNVVEAARQVMIAMGATDVDEIIPPAGDDMIPPEIQQQMMAMQQQAQQMQQMLAQLGAELQAANQMLMDKSVENQIKAFEAYNDAILKRANAQKALADAQAKGDQLAIQAYTSQIGAVEKLGKSLEAIFSGNTQQSVGQGMAFPPGNGMAPQALG
jgi:chaperonin GroES